MTKGKLALCIVFLSGFIAIGFFRGTPVSGAASHEGQSFERVQALFEQRCVKCHSGEDPAAGLRLGSYEEVMQGADGEKVVVPGKPDESELVRRVTGEDEPRMPLGQEPLSGEEIDLIVRWVEGGAEK
jgi:mono/diheme cytochrome c family protein